MVAGIIGGAGGAGTSYATNNFGFGFSDWYYVKDPNFAFVSLGCIGEDKLSKEEVKKLVKEVPETSWNDAVHDLGRLTEVKKGCFKIQSFTKKKGGEFSRVAFELFAWKGDNSPSEGIAIWSSLFLHDKKATLVSRAVYLKQQASKKDSRLIAEKGLQFTTTIEGVSDVSSLKDLLKQSELGRWHELRIDMDYRWINNSSSSQFKLLEQMKIQKEGEKALFFGKDFGNSVNTVTKFQTVISGIYSRKYGWQKSVLPEVKINKPLFGENVKGRWI